MPGVEMSERAKRLSVIIMDTDFRILGESEIAEDIHACFRYTCFVSEEGLNIQLLDPDTDRMTFATYAPIILLAAAVLAGSCAGDGVRTVNFENSLKTKPDTVGIESIAQKIEKVELKCDSLYDITLFAVYDGRLFGTTADL